MIQYEDFSIKIEPQREDVYPVIVLRSPAGEGRSSFHLPFDPDDLGGMLRTTEPLACTQNQERSNPCLKTI